MTQDPWDHPLMRGYKISVSISTPTSLLEKIDDFRMEHRMNMSTAGCRLWILGLVYDRMLQEEKAEKQAKKDKPKAKKKEKPKTPSK